MKKIINKAKKVHFIGIGGISMSALAEYLILSGYCVTGSDLTLTAITDRLVSLGAKVFCGHDEKNVGDAEVVVYTSAINDTNPELMYARSKNLVVMSRETLLGKIFNSYEKRIAVSGAHGKTTTTSLIVTALDCCNVDPTGFIGGLIEKKGNLIKGNSDVIVAEACEYKASFLTLKPSICVILNIDMEHLDYYKQLVDIEKAFNKFAKKTGDDGYVIVNGDQVPYYILNGVKAKSITFGFNKDNDYFATNVKQIFGKYSCDVFCHGVLLTKLDLNIRGIHNIYNAMVALIVANLLNCNISVATKAINEFCGTQRRWMLIENPFTNIVEDYAHHPNEIIAVLKTAKLLGYRKIIVAFQPHTFTRTQKLFNDFVTCFNGIDKLILLPIYPAREQPIENVTSERLCEVISDVGKVDCEYATDFENAKEKIKQIATSDDLVLILGAGNINKLSLLLRQ